MLINRWTTLGDEKASGPKSGPSRSWHVFPVFKIISFFIVSQHFLSFSASWISNVSIGEFGDGMTLLMVVLEPSSRLR